MSAVPGLSLRDTVAAVIHDTPDVGATPIALAETMADAILREFVVALRQDTREGWAWRGADERGWLVYWSPDCTKDATERVLVVPVDPPASSPTAARDVLAARAS